MDWLWILWENKKNGRNYTKLSTLRKWIKNLQKKLIDIRKEKKQNCKTDTDDLSSINFDFVYRMFKLNFNETEKKLSTDSTNNLI